MVYCGERRATIMKKALATILFLILVVSFLPPSARAGNDENGDSNKRNFFRTPTHTPTPTPTFIPLPTFTPTPTVTPTPSPTPTPTATPTPLPFGVQGSRQTPTGRELLVGLAVLAGTIFVGIKVREGIIATAEKKLTKWLKHISP